MKQYSGMNNTVETKDEEEQWYIYIILQLFYILFNKFFIILC